MGAILWMLVRGFTKIPGRLFAKQSVFDRMHKQQAFQGHFFQASSRPYHEQPEAQLEQLHLQCPVSLHHLVLLCKIAPTTNINNSNSFDHNSGIKTAYASVLWVNHCAMPSSDSCWKHCKKHFRISTENTEHSWFLLYHWQITEHFMASTWAHRPSLCGYLDKIVWQKVCAAFPYEL